MNETKKSRETKNKGGRPRDPEDIQQLRAEKIAIETEKLKLQRDQITLENKRKAFEFAVSQGEYVRIEDMKPQWSKSIELTFDVIAQFVDAQTYNLIAKEVKRQMQQFAESMGKPTIEEKQL